MTKFLNSQAFRRGYFLSMRATIGISLLLLLGTVSSVDSAVPNHQGEAPEHGRSMPISPEESSYDGSRLGKNHDEFLKKSAADESVRLPTSIKPVSYTVTLIPFINGNFTISGHVDITLQVDEATTNVTLHILDIITKNETVTVKPSDDLSGTGIAINQQTYDPERNFYIAQLAESLQVGVSYVISMDFEGYLNDQLAGFYRSTYTDPDGNTRWLAASQMQPTDARRAFPCFDEPAMKATFSITIGRETSMTSISNMPLASTVDMEGQPGWVWDSFETSLPMSTYLVAFVVSDFTFASSNFNDHVLFRVWTREEAISQTDYAIGAGPAILTWYESYFNIPFPLPKQDMIALPDFSLGGMENWGLIAYRETALLFDSELGSVGNLKRVNNVVAHELAHQWFGDLVTMEWWTDLWLNEGFATFMAYLGSDSYEPAWQVMDQFQIDDLHYVFSLDSLESSHPISIPISNPEEINQIFDGISYSKGASIIRMMNGFLTPGTFRAGITNYLNTHAYSNAEQDDLWAALTDQAHADGTLSSDLTVKTIMDTWTLQMGYPVINVVLNGDGSATLTQERFLLVESGDSSDTHVYRWWVPITWTSQTNPDFIQTQPSVWMEDSQDSITIQGVPSAGSWVIFNIQQMGYYRVNYEQSNWDLLAQQLATEHDVIDKINRAQILDDALDLARGGLLSYETALGINSYLSAEIEYVPWAASLDNLLYLENMFTRSSGYGALKNYLLALLTPLYNSVGFEDNMEDPHLDQLKRVLAIDWMCHLDYQDCVDNSVSLFNAWMANPSDLSIISPNLKDTVYCTAIAEGGETEWNFLWNQYLTNTNLAAEQDRILDALGCSKEIWILENYLEMAFTDGSGIRKQDSGSVYSAVAKNDIGRDLAWDYLRANVAEIQAYYDSFSAVAGLVSDVSYEFNTETELNELEQFEADNADVLGSATLSIDQSIERTKINIAWMDQYYDTILGWLQTNGYGVSRAKTRQVSGF